MVSLGDWDNIASDPEYTALAPGDKETVQKNWFSRFVTSDPEYTALPEQQRVQVETSFYERAKAADTYTAAPESRGFVADAASHFLLGAVEAVGNIGSVLEMADATPGAVDTEKGLLDRAGESLSDWAEDKAQSVALLPTREEQRGEYGFVKRGILGGIRSTPMMAAPFAAGAVGTLAGGPVAGVIAGGGTLVATFGVGQYGQEYDDVITELDQTRPDLSAKEKQEVAHRAALGSASFEVGTEAVSDLAALITFGGSKAITQPLKATLKNMIQSSGQDLLLKGVRQAGIETASEMVAGGGQAWTRQQEGLSGPSIGEGVAESIIPALTMSLFMGVGGAGLNRAQSGNVLNMLNSDNVDQRIEAVNFVGQNIAKNTNDSELANAWLNGASKVIDSGAKFDFNERLVEFAQVKTTEDMEGAKSGTSIMDAGSVDEAVDAFNDAVARPAQPKTKAQRDTEAEAMLQSVTKSAKESAGVFESMPSQSPAADSAAVFEDPERQRLEKIKAAAEIEPDLQKFQRRKGGQGLVTGGIPIIKPDTFAGRMVENASKLAQELDERKNAIQVGTERADQYEQQREDNVKAAIRQALSAVDRYERGQVEETQDVERLDVGVEGQPQDQRAVAREGYRQEDVADTGPAPVQEPASEGAGEPKPVVQGVPQEATEDVTQRAQSVADKLGITYNGLTEMPPEMKARGYGDQYTFTDPETKSTFTTTDLAETGAKLDELRERFGRTDLPKAESAKVETKPTEEAALLKSFKTEKGSIYQVQIDGSTVRDKAARQEHPGEEGVQPKSDSTYYLTEDQADKLSLVQAKGGDPMEVALLPGGGGQIGVRYRKGGDKGKFVKETIVTPSSSPKVGLYPLEIKKGYSEHFGNKIVEVEQAASSGVGSTTKKKPSTTQEPTRGETKYSTKNPFDTAADDLVQYASRRKKDALLRNKNRDSLSDATPGVKQQAFLRQLEADGFNARRSVSFVGAITKPRKALSQVAREFGYTPQFYKTTDKQLNVVGGTIIPEAENTIFLNAGRDGILLSVTGHELLHELKDNHPDLYQFLLDSESDNIKNFDLYLNDVLGASREDAGLNTPEGVYAYEECFADFMGDQLTNPDFYRKLHNENPTLADRIIDVIREVLNKVADAAQKVFVSERYFKDLSKAQDTLAQVVSEFKKRSGGVEESGVAPRYSAKGEQFGPVDTNSKAFRDWFGDSAVVDKGGKPLVVYHGGSFDENQGSPFRIPGEGVFFAGDKGLAEKYGRSGRVTEGFLKIENPFTPESLDGAPPPGWLREWISFWREDEGWVDRQTGEELDDSGVLDLIANTELYNYESDGSGERWHDLLGTAREHHDGFIGKDPTEGLDDYGEPGTVYVVFDPTQIKSATGNRGTFDPTNPDIRYSTKAVAESVASTKPPKEVAALFGEDHKTTREKVTDTLGLIKDKEAWEAAATKTLDKLLPIKTKVSERAYRVFRIMPSAQDLLGLMIHHGKVDVDDNGNPIVTGRKEGLKQLFEKAGGDWHKLPYWVAAKRAEQLDAEGRENWLTQEKRDEVFKWAGKSDNKKMNELAKELMAFNDSVLDYAYKNGLISKEFRESDALNKEFYIPFYRILEDEKTKSEFLTGPTKSKKYISAKIKKLTGAEAKLGDPLENLLKNWTHLLTEGARNRAVSEVGKSETAIAAGVVEEVPANKVKSYFHGPTKRMVHTRTDEDGTVTKFQKDEKTTYVQDKNDTNIIMYQKDGEATYLQINDPELFNAMMGLNLGQFDNLLLKMFRTTKRWLTIGATFGPAFRVANALRDTMQTSLLNKSFKPFADTYKGFISSMKEDQAFIEYIAAGGGSGSSYVNADDPKSTSDHIKRIIKKDGKGAVKNILNTPKKLLDFWDKVGAASEYATKVQYYQNLVEAGSERLDAAFEARDILDFSLSGASKTVQTIIQTIPFVNARAQGLYKLGRAAMDKDNRRNFITRGAILTAASMALWTLFKDDERYEALEDWDKWSYYHFWIGDNHFRIPQPFEVGAIFSALPVTFLDVLDGNDETKHIADFLGYTATNTFAVSLPQLVAPMAEQWANKSTFTGRPIVGMALEGLKAGEQAEPWTSEALQLVGDALNISPKRAEAVVDGYFSTLGSFVLSGADMVVRNTFGFPDQPTGKIDDYPLAGRFVKSTKGVRSSKYQTWFYDTFSDMDEIVKTINYYKKTGEYKKAEALAKANKKALVFKGQYNKVRKQLTDINNKVKAIYRSTTMDAATKRKRVNALYDERGKLVENAYRAFYR